MLKNCIHNSKNTIDGNLCSIASLTGTLNLTKVDFLFFKASFHSLLIKLVISVKHLIISLRTHVRMAEQ